MTTKLLVRSMKERMLKKWLGNWTGSITSLKCVKSLTYNIGGTEYESKEISSKLSI
mgnify:FL=1